MPSISDARRASPRPLACRALVRTALAVTLCAPLALPAQANNYGENLAWQFRTASDLAVQMSLRDVLEKRRGGFYSAPVYNTVIDRQFNCSIDATAIGNEDSQAALANSPSTTGAAATATGNDNSTSAGAGSVESAQSNHGPVGAGVTGSTRVAVNGTSWQALNSSQSNSGKQSASVSGSTACTFGALN